MRKTTSKFNFPLYTRCQRCRNGPRALFTYILIVCLIIQIKCDEIYTNKYDGVDLDEILSSSRLLSGYVNCLLDAGPCTADANELKKNLPDAIENDCQKCTKRQQEGADKIMHFIIDQRPDDWERLEKKYNSDGSYKKKYLTRLHPEEEKSTTKSDENEDKLEE